MDTYNGYSYCECREVLKDYLEIKYPSEGKEHDEIIGQLLSRYPIESYEIHMIDGIIFNDILMVIKDNDPRKIRHLYIIDSTSNDKRFFPYIFDDYKIMY